MVHSTCPSCGTSIPDPAWHFCPSCGSRLPGVRGQDFPAAPAAGFHRQIPAILVAAGLLLVLAGAIMLMQGPVSRPVPVPAAAEAGTLAAVSVTPKVPGTPGNGMPQGLFPADLNNTGNAGGREPPVNTTPAEPGLSRTSTYTGPVETISGTPPYTYNAPAMGSSTEVPVINTTSLAARVHELVNGARQEHGLSALGTEAALASVARAHSADMAAHGYFGHVNLQEMDPTARGAAAGYTCRKDYDTYYTYGIAENLFAMYRYDSVLFLDGMATEYEWNTEEMIAEATVNSWMNSTDHRDNILDASLKREGIGVAISEDDLVFVTEDFC